MILDGKTYKVLAENHTESVPRKRSVRLSLSGKTLISEGRGAPHAWKYRLKVREAGDAVYGDMADLEATCAKQTPPSNVLSMTDERGVSYSVVILPPFPEFSSKLQVLTSDHNWYEVDLELQEVLA